MIIHHLIKINFFSIIYVYIALNPAIAYEPRDYLIIDRLVKSCYINNDSCEKSLSRIHIYQKNAAKNKKFSCQTRLLGLEANLIMAMNSNFKRKEAKSIIDSIKKYC